MFDFNLPQAVLVRNTSNEEGTFGKLTFGDFGCFTCELPWRDNHPDTSCIPTGIYHCSWTLSPRLQRETYEILNVKDRNGIRIHSANYPDELLGCIAFGKTIMVMNGKKGIFESRVTIKAFEELLGKRDFVLEIK